MSARVWDRRRQGKRLACAVHYVIKHPDAMRVVNGNCVVMGLDHALDLHLR